MAHATDAGGAYQRLSVRSLSQAVDDTAWPSEPSGRRYSTDSTNHAIDVVTGPVRSDLPLVVATPCGASDTIP
jgi:hypothetical protein